MVMVDPSIGAGQDPRSLAATPEVYTDFIHPKGKEVDLVPQKTQPLWDPPNTQSSNEAEAETL